MSRNLSSRFGAVACGLLVTALTACANRGDLSSDQRGAIARQIDAQVRAAYDLSRPDAEQRMEALYVDTGRVVSASGGQVIASRDTILQGIRLFWKNVGVNMRQPQWIWDKMVVDVLAPNAAVMTATYHIPHLTPQNQPHVIAGAWTAAFEKRGSRWYVVQEHLSDVPTAPDSTARPGMQPGATMPGMTMPPKTATPGTPKRGSRNPR